MTDELADAILAASGYEITTAIAVVLWIVFGVMAFVRHVSGHND